jgi:hypothetical protein
MARTFSYQRQQRNRQAPPLRATWRTPPAERNVRGPFATLADKVREHRKAATTGQVESARAIYEIECEI